MSSSPWSKAMADDIVIIGAGLCGARAAFALREKGFAGRLTLIGDEAYEPYDRPPLSKAGLNPAPAFIAESQAYRDAGITLMTGNPVLSIDRAARRVWTVDGRELAYDRLLLATGAHARQLPNYPAPRHLLTLRSHADALAIGARLSANTRLIVIGGGFIGLELAAMARQAGAKVALIESQKRLLARAVPAEIAAVVEDRHRDEGVDILLGATIASIEEHENEISVKLIDGRAITGDLAVLGIGAAPNVELAGAAGLALDNGIAVDQYLVTSDPDILAAGDCCSFPMPLYGQGRVRLESWRSAQDQGILAAGNLMGERIAVAHVPWFWSDQFDLSLQIAGLAGSATQTVRRDLDGGAFILFHLDGAGRLLAASGIGMGNAVARDIRLAEMLIAARACPNPDALASTSVRLKSLLAA